MKYFRAFVASVLFLLLLLGTYWLHVIYFRVNVVLYSAMLDCVIAAALTTSVLSALGYFRGFHQFERVQLLLIWLLLGYALAISVPTVIDRSLSFYILEKLHQRGGGIRQDRFEQVFTQEYVKEHRLVDVRLTEQQASGTIVIRAGCVLLTARGERLASFSRFFRQHFLPRHRLLLGVYSDDLVDPFRHSIADPGYGCRIK